MLKKLVWVTLTLLLATASPSWAGPTLDRIQKTGTITAGARKDAIPFGYVNAQGQWVGYSLDILELIRQQAEKRLGKPIRLKLVEATPEERFNLLQQEAIDVECSSTTFTWARTAKVDFSVSYFADGTKILTRPQSGLESAESLAGKNIGVIMNTTNERAMQVVQPAAKLIPVKDQADGLQKLEAGVIDAFAGDGIVLEGLRQRAKNPQAWVVTPAFPYQYEAYACSLPKDDSDWRHLVNYALLQYMEGIVSDQMTAVNLYEKWFGEAGVVPYPRDTINDYFQGIINGYEWIPIVDY
jgi:polar amino acid transport system substrate-binding protein